MKPQHVDILMILIKFLLLHGSSFVVNNYSDYLIEIDDEYNNFQIQFTTPMKYEYDFELHSTSEYHENIKGDVEKIKAYLKEHYFKEEE